MTSIMQNNAYLIIEKSVTLAAGFLASVLLARYLGVEAFGLLSYVLAVSMILTPVSRMGLAGILTQEFVTNTTQRQVVLASALFIRVLAAIFIIALLLLLHFSLKLWVPIVWYGILAIAICQIFSAVRVTYFIFEADNHHGPIVSARVTAVLISLVMKLWGMYAQLAIDYFVMLLAVDILLLSLIPLFTYFKNYGPLAISSFSWECAKNLLRKSFWLLLSGIAAILYLKIDQLMIGSMLGNEQLGIYSVASRLSEVWYFLPATFATVLFPRLLSAIDSRRALVNSALFVTLISGVGIAFIMIMIAHLLIPILFGVEYSDASEILIIQMLPLGFMFMREIISKCLLMDKLYSYSLYSHGLGLVINIALNLLLIPWYGILGAAIATVISYTVASYLCFALFSATRHLFHQINQSLFKLFKPWLWLDQMRRIRACLS